MLEKYVLHIADYIIIVISLLISISIGVFVRYYGNTSSSAVDYFLAGRKMSKFPVIFSIVVTMISPISMLSTSMELYKYGLQVCMGYVTIPLGMLITSYVIIPVYYQCDVSTVSEYLEMRFGKYTRAILSAVIFLQMIMYMAATLFGSVLALTVVTDMSLEMCIIFLGIVCTIYCTMGGLRAVLWTDVYQFTLMIICLLAIYIRGISDGGGLSTIFSRLSEGKRLSTFDSSISFTNRYTIWNCFANGLIFGIAGYGTAQIEVQRILSLSNANRASSTLRWSIIPVFVTFILCVAPGLILYSIYYNCDPVLNKRQTGIGKYDQVVVYYIISAFRSMPGVTGLCIAGIFSASLSTISSALNSVSTVTVVDFIKPIMRMKGKTISDRKTVYVAKGLSVLYGGLSIGISFLFLGLPSLIVTMNTIINSTQGSILVLFLLGVLTRKGSDKVIAICFILSAVSMSWISVGSLYSGYQSPTLPLSTSNCTTSFNTSEFSLDQKICTNTEKCPLSFSPPKITKKEPFVMFKISYLWQSSISLFIALVFMTAGILISGWKKNAIPADSKCLSPITRYWIKKQDLILKEEKISDSTENIVTSKI